MMKITANRLFAAAIVLIYLYSFPYFPKIHSANELPRIYLTYSLIEHKTIQIDPGIRRWGATADTSTVNGHSYSNKPPGSSLLAVPAYLVLKGIAALGGDQPSLAQLMWTFRFATSTLPALLFLLLLWRFIGRFTTDDRCRRLALAAYALGTLAMTYAILFIAHQLASVLIFSALVVWLEALEQRKKTRWFFVGGLLAGCAPLCDYQTAFIGVPLAIWLLIKLLPRTTERRPWALIAAAAGALPPLATLLGYHALAFGHPLKTGVDSAQAFAHHHTQGFLGITALRSEAFIGSFFSPDKGLFFFSPFLLLALVGWVLMARRRQWTMLLLSASVVAIFVLFISSINFWRGGWQFGPRYITAMLPFLLIPIAVTISRWQANWALRAICVGLISASIVIYTLGNALYPHFPESFRNPLYEIVFRLLVDGYAPYNLGWLIGLRGTASLIPLLITLGALLIFLAIPDRRALRSGLLGLALAAGIIAAYAAVPRTPAGEQTYRQYVAGAMPK
ncbi:MAG: glycosyltransferase family 39 protein [Deltaproteobacteria bacterium]|nr:glycosyltransferase family 39 protein [Deltaproteobacteria bacterium]